MLIRRAGWKSETVYVSNLITKYYQTPVLKWNLFFTEEKDFEAIWLWYEHFVLIKKMKHRRELEYPLMEKWKR